MPEIQKADQTNGQMTQRFIEFIMMQAQQAALCLGRIPHPSTGETIVNLDAARMFIDNLELIREKTQGNLSKDEEKILVNILSELQLNFVQVLNASGDTQSSTEAAKVADLDAKKESSPSVDSTKTSSEDEEHKKRFSKSYGS